MLDLVWVLCYFGCVSLLNSSSTVLFSALAIRIEVVTFGLHLPASIS
nr:MAG TPA: hypothetical protein [Bacteriophage sp.]